jgi:hypothetical protein
MIQQASPIQQFWAQAREQWQQLQEWRYARRVCSEALAAYDAVHRRRPDLCGDALYEAVIMRRTKLDAAGARRLLEDAHVSREDWDNERRARFRDVVMYMIVTEYLGRAPSVQGMHIDLAAYLEQRVPEDF